MWIEAGFIFYTFEAAYGALACSMCKAGLISAINPQYLTKLAEGYFWSILLMISVPFLLIGAVATLLLKHRRR